MLQIVGKKVVAIGITPRIYDEERDRIREFLDGTHPMSSHRKNYDSGTKRLTVLDQSAVGPNEISYEKDDRNSHSNVGSGGTQGINPGGRADDETGPGNMTNSDPEQDFMSHDNADLAFDNANSTSSKWSPLNYESNKRDKNITHYLRRLYQEPGVGALPKRHDVDRLTRSKAASSSWRHKYSV